MTGKRAGDARGSAVSAIETRPIQAAPCRVRDIDPASVLVPLERSDLEAHEAAIARMAVDEAQCAGAEPVHVTFRGRTMTLVPLDPARFNRAMAAHISLN